MPSTGNPFSMHLSYHAFTYFFLTLPLIKISHISVSSSLLGNALYIESRIFNIAPLIFFVSLTTESIFSERLTDIRLFLMPKLSANTSNLVQLVKRCGFLQSKRAYSIINIFDLSPSSKALFKNFCLSAGLSARLSSRFNTSINSIFE